MRLWAGVPVTNAVAWASFLTLYFGCVALLVYLPLLLGARRFLQRPAAVALLGGLLFPVPLLAFPALQGRFESAWAVWSRTPVTAAWNALPYLAAGALLGWLLAEQASPRPSTAS
jgi:hypothetical protein